MRSVLTVAAMLVVIISISTVVLWVLDGLSSDPSCSQDEFVVRTTGHQFICVRGHL